jgi:hypothetical protein
MLIGINKFGCLILAALLLAGTGCGGAGEFATVRVTGTIKTEAGEPLQSGIVSFRPQEVNAEGNTGKAAFGRINNGEFELTTYRSGDGAIAGKHNVFLAEKPNKKSDHPKALEKHNCELTDAFKEVEVSSSAYHFDIIVKKKKIDPRRRGRQSDDDDDDDD